jgi:hypothetical protein
MHQNLVQITRTWAAHIILGGSTNPQINLHPSTLGPFQQLQQSNPSDLIDWKETENKENQSSQPLPTTVNHNRPFLHKQDINQTQPQHHIELSVSPVRESPQLA